MDRWPFTIPAVHDLVEKGFEPPPGLTVFIGENGSGKSTLALVRSWRDFLVSPEHYVKYLGPTDDHANR
jgi:predicted ATPase